MLTWDENKRRANLKNHGIDFAEVEDVFNHFMDTQPDNADEYRLKSLCWLKDRVVVLIWIELEDYTRIISCREATGYETRIYAERATF
jgi:uncharacterized DUF497 family protein